MENYLKWGYLCKCSTDECEMFANHVYIRLPSPFLVHSFFSVLFIKLCTIQPFLMASKKKLIYCSFQTHSSFFFIPKQTNKKHCCLITTKILFHISPSFAELFDQTAWFFVFCLAYLLHICAEIVWCKRPHKKNEPTKMIPKQFQCLVENCVRLLT